MGELDKKTEATVRAGEERPEGWGRRWLDPSNVMAIARVLGMLLLTAAGGYAWLWRHEIKMDALLTDVAVLEIKLEGHLKEAEKWKRKILILEDRDRQLNKSSWTRSLGSAALEVEPKADNSKTQK